MSSSIPAPHYWLREMLLWIFKPHSFLCFACLILFMLFHFYLTLPQVMQEKVKLRWWWISYKLNVYIDQSKLGIPLRGCFVTGEMLWPPSSFSAITWHLKLLQSPNWNTLNEPPQTSGLYLLVNVTCTVDHFIFYYYRKYLSVMDRSIYLMWDQHSCFSFLLLLLYFISFTLPLYLPPHISGQLSWRDTLLALFLPFQPKGKLCHHCQFCLKTLV